MRRLAVTFAIVTAVLVCSLATAASADDAAPNNVVLVTTTADHLSDARSHMQLASYAGDTLDSTNLARADSHDCTGCHGVAVAVQAVFATGHPSTVTPRNLAIATNENCTDCATFAFAYQYVVTTDGPVRLTKQGREQMAQLRQEFRDAANSGLPFDQLDARLHQLAALFTADINAQLRHAGERPGGSVREHESQTPDTGS